MSSQSKVFLEDIPNSKVFFLNELMEAIKELNDVLANKTKAKDAYDFLDLLDAMEQQNEPTRPFEDVKR